MIIWQKHLSSQLHLWVEWDVKSDPSGLLGEGGVGPKPLWEGPVPLAREGWGPFSGLSCSLVWAPLLKAAGGGHTSYRNSVGTNNLNCIQAEMILHQVLNSQQEQIFQDKALTLSALQNLLFASWMCCDGIFYPAVRCLHRVYLCECISERTWINPRTWSRRNQDGVDAGGKGERGNVTGGKEAGHSFWKNDIAQGHNINRLESNGTKMDLDPQSASEMTHPEARDSSKALLKDQGVGGGPNPGNLRPFPTIGGIVLHSLAYEITQPLKTNHATFRDCCALPSVMAHTVYGVRFSLSLNKSTLHLPLCLSLNSFCDQTSRTWASLGPATRYCGFGLGSSPNLW